MDQTSSLGLEPRAVFGFMTFVPTISSPKQTIWFLAPFFYRAQTLNYRNRLHRHMNPGQFWEIHGLCSCKLPAETNMSVLAPFCYRA